MKVDGELTTVPSERAEREMGGHINAATARWLALVGEFDRREAWAEWGCRARTGSRTAAA